MMTFDFNTFHNTWGQMLEYKQSIDDPDHQANTRIEKVHRGSFIVQSISDDSVNLQYNITGSSGMFFYSNVQLSLMDTILLKNKEYQIVGIVDQYPNAGSVQYKYVAYIVGSLND